MQFPSTQYNALFQSTLSMRRATAVCTSCQPDGDISIHALHEESDRTVFNHLRNRISISIHALHEESDHRFQPFAQQNQYFNPRSP